MDHWPLTCSICSTCSSTRGTRFSVLNQLVRNCISCNKTLLTGDLPVRLLVVFNASRLECEKSMLQTASDQQSLRLLPSLARRVVAAVLESRPSGELRIFGKDFHTPHSNTVWCLLFDHRGYNYSLAHKSIGKPYQCRTRQAAVKSWPIYWSSKLSSKLGIFDIFQVNAEMISQ